MTSPTEIPEALKAKAEALLDSIEACGCDECSRIALAALLQVRNEAIAEEREQCAKECDEYAAGFERGLFLYGDADKDSGRGRQEGHINSGRALAAAIRARP